MGQSFVINYIHIVFSTKYRQKLIYPSYEKELHNYISGICRNMECLPLAVGGYTDHIHILCMLSKKIALMELVEKVKSHSSKWMKTKDESLKNFYWAGRALRLLLAYASLAKWIQHIFCKSKRCR